MPTPVVKIACEFRYEAAHWLPNVPEGHQCGRMHGHSYHLTVNVSGPVGDDGFVVDFAHIKNVVEPLVKRLDHHTLNEIDGLKNPTVELQLVWFWNKLAAIIPGLYELTLRETANNSATYRGNKARDLQEAADVLIRYMTGEAQIPHTPETRKTIEKLRQIIRRSIPPE